MAKEKAVLGVIGVILIILGMTLTIPVANKGMEYWPWLLATGIAIVVGVILMAWAFSE
ncbi:MAG: hypothetical protein Q8R00_02740 [Candidatus Nanoarchaeia archaeon]|nr:hypothetical protein [Candidatus Nanoarchaeia archaeon]